MRLGWPFILSVLIAIVVVVWWDRSNFSDNHKSITRPVPAALTCHALDNGALPDPKCTPGIFYRAVTQRTINKTICVPNWTATIRPPVSETEPLKFKLMRAYGIHDSVRNYELDHLIPLELGGDPSSPQNLFPEPHHIMINGKDEGSYVKDGWENKLRARVCSKQMKLAQARRIIKNGAWIGG